MEAAGDPSFPVDRPLSEPTSDSDEIASEAFLEAVAAFAEGDADRALARAQRAHLLEPERLLYGCAARFLARLPEVESVYRAPEAFTAFADGGGNVALYREVSQALGAIYEEYEALHLLDIGVGYGKALLPALNSHVAEVSAVEPSRALLERAEQALRATGTPFHGFAMTLQDFAEGQRGHWGLAQATFSLQSLEPKERIRMMAWLREHCDRLLVVEFDVPTFSSLLHPAHIRSVCRRYERGLGEYLETRDLVAQGFLMPVMFGYFHSGARRANHEHTLERWVEQIQPAGFAKVSTRPIHDYWWGTAHLLDARSESAPVEPG